MWSIAYRGIAIALQVVVICFFCSCSGGTTHRTDLGGGEDLPTVAGELSGGQVPGGGGAVNPSEGTGGGTSPIAGGGEAVNPANVAPSPPAGNVPEITISHESANAPLGTNPAYNVVPAQSTVIARGASRAASELDELVGLQIIAVSVARHDVAPVADMAIGPFAEGDVIDLWVDYEAMAHVDFSREWIIEGAGLDFVENNLSHNYGGVYSAKLEFLVPYDAAGENLTFQVVTALPKGTSTLAVAPIVADSRSLVFSIEDTPVDPTENYPGTTDPDDETGLWGGHFDVDTSSFISVMRPVDDDPAAPMGSTDAHVHEYDNRYNVTGCDFFNFLRPKLHEITEDVPDGSTKFKIIVANADLSPGGRLVINKDYSASSSSTYTPVTSYDNTALSNLPVYSFDGVEGSIPLEEFGMYFGVDAILTGGLIPTCTGDVRANHPGLNGEWRNGALTIQAVLVNPDGTDGFTTEQSLSAGGVHGVATSGLLWECTLFWHWVGPSYHMVEWGTYWGGRPVGASQMGMMAWEDQLVNVDYDYNDLVTTMDVLEHRNGSDQLVQIDMLVKALARGTVHNADWQLNVNAAFPGAGVVAYVNQYYDDGDSDYTNDIRHGTQRIWRSSDGASIPIFAPTCEALPCPPEGTPQTNTVAGTTWMEGDYAKVTIVLEQPMSQGTYTPMPYEPELRVASESGGAYTIGLWQGPGGPVDGDGQPLGFIVPDLYAWPQEGESILSVYPEVFPAWVDWINDPVNYEEPCELWYRIPPVGDYCDPVNPIMFN